MLGFSMTKDERMLFLIGLVGVFLVGVVTYMVPCPTEKQGSYSSVALGLMAALVAMQIPGMLQFEINSSFLKGLRGGGALGVFVLVAFIVDPLATSRTDEQKRFSNASCQGPLPSGKDLDLSLLPLELDPSVQGSINPANSLGRPVNFTFDYGFGDQKGVRYWSQVKEGVWVEVYPDGNFFSTFREVAQGVHNGCAGIIVRRQDVTLLEVFVPNKECAEVGLWHRQNGSEWNFLGKMENINKVHY